MSTGNKVMGAIVATVMSEAFQRAQKLRAVPSNLKKRTEALGKEITKAKLKRLTLEGKTQAEVARLYGLTDTQMRAVYVHHKIIEE